MALCATGLMVWAALPKLPDGEAMPAWTKAWPHLAAEWRMRLHERPVPESFAWFKERFRMGMTVPNHAVLFAEYAQEAKSPAFANYLFLWDTVDGVQYTADITVDVRDDRIVDFRADALRLVGPK